MNTISIVGNLTNDPELRYSPGGRAYVKFSIASNRRYLANNEWQEETSFFSCIAWGDQAANIAESIEKGTRVILLGRLESRKWETADGSPRTSYEVVVEECGPSLRWATTDVKKTERNVE